MSNQLETAEHPEKLRRVVIEPVTRVEGHGKVTLLQDEDNHIRQARLHIVEFRGFEKFIQGRPYWELPVLVQRLCGICPVSHHLAAAKATDMLVGSTLTPTAEKIRRLMHYGQTLQSHALHFFHLCSPDLLFGFDDEVRHRNIVGVIEDHPEIAKQGVLLRKYGQEVIRLTAGKRVHGTGAIPGGVNKSLDRGERDYLQADIEQIIEWSQGAVDLIKQVFLEQLDYHLEFGATDSNMLSMVAPDGDADVEPARLETFRVPGCRRCGGMLKPDVVFFGESVPKPRVAKAYRAVEESDALLVELDTLGFDPQIVVDDDSFTFGFAHCPFADLADPRVEITGPVDRKMMINALNSGARTFMADFEDSLTPGRRPAWGSCVV